MSINLFSSTTIPFLPVGYPLSYFAGIEPFKTWLGHEVQSRNARIRFSRDPRQGLGATQASSTQVPGITDGTGETEQPPDTLASTSHWTEQVRLERFTSRQFSPNGPYEHIVEFSATRQIAIALPEPKGTIALFGKEPKRDEVPPRLRLRFIVEPKNGYLDRLEINGAIRFQLPLSLVQPVVERDGRWVNMVKRHVILPLGNSTLTLRRETRPKLSMPLAAPRLTVRIGRSGLVASLNSAVVDIAGRPAKPILQFQNVRLVYLEN